MNSSIFCMIFLAALTSQGCLAQFKHHDGPRFMPTRSQPESNPLESFRASAHAITVAEMNKLIEKGQDLNKNGMDMLKTFIGILVNTTDNQMRKVKANFTQVETDTKASLKQASEVTIGYFNILISAVKDKSIKDLIKEAERLNGSLEAKAVSLEHSVDQKILEINENLRAAVQVAYKTEAADYWRKIQATNMAEIISEARRGVEDQVSALLAQHFTNSLQRYEAQLQSMEQFYVDKVAKRIGELEALKNMYAQELMDLAASLKEDLVAAKESKALQPNHVTGSNGAGHEIDVNSAGHRTDVNGAGHEIDVNGAGHEIDVNGAGHEIDVNGAGHEIDVNGAGHRTDVNGAGHEIDVNGAGHQIDVNGAGHETGSNGADHEVDVEGADHETGTSNEGFENDVDDSDHANVPTYPPAIETSTELNPSTQVHSFFNQFRGNH